MKILFIAEAYAPDSIIGAQRIIKLTKYLSQFGHEVTVMASSRLWGKRDANSLIGLECVRILRYDENQRGSTANAEQNGKQNNILRRILPRPLYLFLKTVYVQTVMPYRRIRESGLSFHMMQECYNEKLQYERFDFVFATYSTLANVLMGEYLSKQFGMRLILDLRDRMDNSLVPFALRLRNYRIQKRIISEACITLTVSQVVAEELRKENPRSAHKIFALYNGFDSNKTKHNKSGEKDKILSFAYTGGLYSGKRDLRVLFHVLRMLYDSSPNLYRFSVEYAGVDYEEILRQASEYHLESIVKNHGSVGREEAENIQNEADVFLVASWNSKREQGIIPGKLFEGIRADKPIITIVTGSIPGSELAKINEIFHYGFCCENIRYDSTQALFKYVLGLHEAKCRGELKNFHLSDEIKERFHYRNITKELETHMRVLFERNKSY